MPSGRRQTVNAQMVVALEKQQVTVQENSANLSVQSENNASALVLKGKDLDALSDDPDELASQLQALAGPAAGPNGGEIYIDGFTGGQLPTKSSIREIRVNQNPFSAQYDKLGYGRIEIFTKPGTDNGTGREWACSMTPLSIRETRLLRRSRDTIGNSWMEAWGDRSARRLPSFSMAGAGIWRENSIVSAVVLDSSLQQTASAKRCPAPTPIRI